MLCRANLGHSRKRGDALRNVVEVERRLFRGTRLPTRRLNAEAEHAARIESKIDAAQAPQRLRHQTRPDDEHHRERDFHDDERLSRRHARSARRTGARNTQRTFGIDSRRKQRRRYTERETDHQRDDRRHEQHAPIDRDRGQHRQRTWQDRL